MFPVRASDFRFVIGGANVSEAMKEKTLFYQQELPFSI